MLKRIFDIFFSSAVLIPLTPLLVLVALLIKVTSRGPVFYRGERIGLHGKPFRMYKFRSMVMNADKLGGSSVSEDDPRITWIGRLLRRSKLDELPQFLNVLIGEMSVVGPRPQVAWIVQAYNEEEKQLLKVKPGITDYASIKFRNLGEILRGSPDPDKTYLQVVAPEKVRLGLEYVNNHSFWIDLKIIFHTFVSLFIRKATPPRSLDGTPNAALTRDVAR